MLVKYIKDKINECDINIEKTENSLAGLVEIDVITRLRIELNDVLKVAEEEINYLLRYLDKWEEWLGIDGSNTKSMVRNDIQYIKKLLAEKEKK